MLWLAIIPPIIELLWFATWRPKWRRWAKGLAEAQGPDWCNSWQRIPADDYDHRISFVYMVLGVVLVREWNDQVPDVTKAVAVRQFVDLDWSGWFGLYHLPVILVIGSGDNPLIASGRRTIGVMTVCGVMYGLAVFVAVKLLT